MFWKTAKAGLAVLALFAAIALTSLVASAQTNLIANGGFEDTTYTPGYYAGDSSTMFQVWGLGTTLGSPGWTLYRATGQEAETYDPYVQVLSSSSGLGAPPEASMYLYLAKYTKAVKVAQTLTAETGKLYKFKFYLMNHPYADGSGRVIVRFGSWSEEITPPKTWTLYERYVTASSGSIEVAFERPEGSDYVCVDDISVTETLNLVANGSFEDDTFTPGYYAGDSSTMYQVWGLGTELGSPGWTLYRANGEEAETYDPYVQVLSSSSGLGAPPQGNLYLYLAKYTKTVKVAQAIATQSNKLYRLRFYLCNHPYGDGSGRVTVRFGSWSEEIVPPKAWTLYERTVPANSSSTELAFERPDGSDFVMVDNIYASELPNFVANGGFEDTTYTPGYFAGDSGSYYQIWDLGTELGIPGWTLQRANGQESETYDPYVQMYSSATGLGTPPEGNMFLYLIKYTKAVKVAQTIPTQANETYRLSFYLLNHPSCDGTGRVIVRFGSWSEEIVPPKTWALYVRDVTATSDNTELAFERPEGSDYVFVDDVYLTYGGGSGQPVIAYSDDVSVDGNLTDWADADWKPFNMVYDGFPVDIDLGSAWAVKWGAGGTKVYMAAKIRDTSHSLTNAYTDWNARDAVEMYINTTGTDVGPYGANDYPVYQEQAQEWAVGITDSNRNAVWATCGYPPAYGNYTPTADEFVAAGHEDGEWLYYEAAMTPFEYFGGRRGNPSVISPLSESDIIRADMVAVGRDVSGYTGMKSSGHAGGGWAGNYTLLAEHRLVRVGVKGTITLQDFGAGTLGAAATITITDANNVSEIHNIVLDGAGTYSFKTALDGNCTAVASAAGYVPESKSVLVTDGEGSADFTLARQSVEPISITDAKKKPVGSMVGITGSITAVFADSIYVESSDRVSGIRVEKINHGLTLNDVGKVVNVTGEVKKDSSTQEVFIDADQIGMTVDTNILEPLGLTNRAAGGGDFFDIAGNGQMGVDGGTGLNNIGLLVRTTGASSNGDAGGFILTDGSGVTLFVSLANAGSTYNGKYVVVTGISGIDSSGARVIKARTSDDVRIIQ